MSASAGRRASRLYSGPSPCLPLSQSFRGRLTSSNHQRRKSSSSAKPPKTGGSLPVAVQQKSKPPKQGLSQEPSHATALPVVTPRRRSRTLVSPSISGDDQPPTHLPSVPSTSYLHPADVAVSSFFSEHRPISVTSAIPDSDTGTSFQKIFARKPRNKPAQVIDLLTGAVSRLENTVAAAEHEAIDQAPDPHELRQAVDPQSIRDLLSNQHHHHHGQNSSPASNALTRSNYQPFQPPPPPVPQKSGFTAVIPTINPDLKTSNAYKMVIRILEKTHPNGMKSINFRMGGVESDPEPPEMDVADPNEIVNYTIDIPRTFLGRMQDRQEATIERMMAKLTAVPPQMLARMSTQAPSMIAISVKRQRKLKMKKHKYKKLMRKTRSLRRRQERG